MQRIDSHQHFWCYHPARDAWIDDTMPVLKQDYLPADLAPLLRQNGFDGCVAVQAGQSPDENRFLLSLAGDHDFIKGVVGWTDLLADDVNEELESLREHKKLKGFRHILQGEENRAFMLQDRFLRGIRALQPHGFTYDILIHADQLQYLPAFLRQFPDQRFVLDHLAKPLIQKGEVEQWAAEIKTAAQFEQLSCKVSGLVTEASWKGWKPEHFVPYLDAVVEAFGTRRLLFGSDWPVCLLAAPYAGVVALAEDYFSAFSAEEKASIFGRNAIQFYNLDA